MQSSHLFPFPAMIHIDLRLGAQEDTGAGTISEPRRVLLIEYILIAS